MLRVSGRLKFRGRVRGQNSMLLIVIVLVLVLVLGSYPKGHQTETILSFAPAIHDIKPPEKHATGQSNQAADHKQGKGATDFIQVAIEKETDH